MPVAAVGGTTLCAARPFRWRRVKDRRRWHRSTMNYERAQEARRCFSAGNHMSGTGPTEKFSQPESMSAVRGSADQICST
jgi:hypothetical protein